MITKEGPSILDPPLDEPKVETEKPRDVEMDPKQTRDTPSKEDPPSQQGLMQHISMEEFISYLEKHALKVSWVDQTKKNKIQKQLDPPIQDQSGMARMEGPHQTQ